MYRFDIFCDASVGPELRGACAGALVEKTVVSNINNKIEHSEPERKFYAIIQPNGTNNSGEVLAVCLGIIHALSLYTEYKVNRGYDIRINIFSDSLITVKGLREWIPNWIKNSDENGVFFNHSRTEVKNQNYFKYIYNMMLMNPGFKVHLYHQDGHVTSNFNSIVPRFRKFNGLYLSDLGLSPAHICINNDTVDKETRRIINEYLIRGDTNGYPVENAIFDRVFTESEYDNYKILDSSDNAVQYYLSSIK